ncbi:MAG TPA: ABC transporter substrate-binding protein [Bryobacteraceae bacterium]|nr:ABC transporter substrate-binding protein [Bryobacteraceae bacterium]
MPTAFGLALQLGWIEAEFARDPDIDIRALQTSADPKVHQSHFSHTQENSFRQGGNLPAVWARANGSDTRVIGLSWIRGPYTALTLPGSGIRTAADLKGRRLLIVRRPNEEIDFVYAMTLRTYEAALASAGLTLADVQLVEHRVERSYVSDRVQPGGNRDYVDFRQGKKGGAAAALVTRLIRGEVDVIPSASVGSLKLVELLGLQVVFDEASLDRSSVNNGKPETFAVSARLAAERPDLVARVLARALQAVEWAANNPADAVRFVARELGASEQQIVEAYGDTLQASLEIDLAPANVEGLRQVQDFLHRHRLIARAFDIDAWIDPGPLQAARALLDERRRTPAYRAEVAPRTGQQPSGVAPSQGCSVR